MTDAPPPPTTTTKAATISFNVQKAKYALVCVIISQKRGLGEEMKPVPHWKVYVLLVETL